MARNIGLDVVYLDENILWKLKDKMSANIRNDKKQENVKERVQSRSKRAPKFQVYQPGVTRLSSRQIPKSLSNEKFDRRMENTSKKNNEGDRHTEQSSVKNDPQMQRDFSLLKSNSTLSPTHRSTEYKKTNGRKRNKRQENNST